MMSIQANKSKSFWGRLIFIAATVIILLSLSFWQWQRLAWKSSLIESFNNPSAISDAPNLPAWDVSLSKPEAVMFFGHYVPELTILVRSGASKNTKTGDAKTSENNTIVYMPFRTTDGVYVIVRRGISETSDFSGQSLATIQNPGTISIIGIPTPRPTNIPMMAQGTQSAVWDYLDWSAIQKRFKTQPLAPYIFAVLDEPDLGLALNRELPPIRNEHRNYAIFWLVMAIVAGTLLTRFLLFPKSGE